MGIENVKRREVLCECCGMNEAEVKDYRDFSDKGYDYFEEYIVCRNCFHLNNYWFLKLHNAKYPHGKKRVISRIIEGNWKDWLTKR